MGEVMILAQSFRSCFSLFIFASQMKDDDPLIGVLGVGNYMQKILMLDPERTKMEGNLAKVLI